MTGALFIKILSLMHFIKSFNGEKWVNKTTKYPDYLVFIIKMFCEA